MLELSSKNLCLLCVLLLVIVLLVLLLEACLRYGRPAPAVPSGDHDDASNCDADDDAEALADDAEIVQCTKPWWRVVNGVICNMPVVWFLMYNAWCTMYSVRRMMYGGCFWRHLRLCICTRACTGLSQ